MLFYHILGQDTKLRPFNNQDATSYDTAVYANEDINSVVTDHSTYMVQSKI